MTHFLKKTVAITALSLFCTVSLAPAASADTSTTKQQVIQITRRVPTQTVGQFSNCNNTVKSRLRLVIKGLDPSTSDGVLAVLKKHGVNAMVFATGTYGRENLDDVRAFVKAGHIFGSLGATGDQFVPAKRSVSSIQQWVLNGALGPRNSPWFYMPQTDEQLYDLRMVRAVNAAGVYVCGVNVDTSTIPGSPNLVVKKTFTGSSVNQKLRRNHTVAIDGKDPNAPVILAGLLDGAKRRGWAWTPKSKF